MPSGAPPRVVVLTHGGEFADRVVLGLALAEAPADELIVAPPAVRPRSISPGTLARRARDAAAGALRRTAGTLERDPFDESLKDWPARWAGIAARVRATAPLNSPAMVAEVESARPDWLVLAGVGIVSEEVLRVPALGTLNVHPALLPWVRGVGVIERSIERGVPVGVTAHYVDPGVDTGPLIRREIVSVATHDTVGSLRRKAYERSTRLLVELTLGARAGERPESVTQMTRYPYCRFPEPDELRRIEESVAAGRAVELYREWTRAAGGRVVPPAMVDDALPSTAVAPER